MRTGTVLVLALWVGLAWPAAMVATDHAEAAHGEEEHHSGEGARLVNSTLVFGGLFLLLRRRGRQWLRSRGEQIVQLIQSTRKEADRQEGRLQQERDRSANLEEEAREMESRTAAPILEQAESLEAESIQERERLRVRTEDRQQQEYRSARGELLREVIQQVADRAGERVPTLLSLDAQRGLVSQFLENLEVEEAR